MYAGAPALLASTLCTASATVYRSTNSTSVRQRTGVTTIGSLVRIMLAGV
jgi:hypothetical protein